MITIADILEGSKDNVIMLFATLDHIAREREALEKWFESRWQEIPRQHELAKAVLLDDNNALAKAAASDRIEARKLAPALLSKWGGDAQVASNQALAESILAKLDAMQTYTKRLDELAALQRRSATLRFAVVPPPAPPRDSGLH